MTAQAGKLIAYVTAGAIVGGFGSALYGLFDQHAAYAVLQRFGALVLIWTAVSLTGILPSPAILARAFTPLSSWAWTQKRRGHGLAALIAGLVWGLLPCGMVYAALMYAMLAGDALRGGLVMLGFGLGVSPLLTASSLGVAWLGKTDRRPALQWAAGLALIAVSVSTLVWPDVAGALCRPVL
jgi:sulfite exporter TauE/SafE